VPFVAVWSKPNAPFLCIEPWHGLPDMSDCSGNIVEKEGIIALEPGSCFGTGYSIEVA
jgi:galactose mutarotase-like enzyme